jgi:hypothetical protein
LPGRQGGRDCTPSSKAALDAIRFRLKRHSTTTLTLADFKVSKPDLLTIWSGPVGVAAGVEFRHETQQDRRDPQLDGRTPFTDPVTGATSNSNVTGVNDTPSTKGSRDVGSAFAELALPLVSPEMNIPLVRRIDVQLAGRFEHYSDFGSVAKPKIAFAWDVVDGVRVRGSWQQGFRAPNLETTNPFSYSRTNTVTDYYRCEADLKRRPHRHLQRLFARRGHPLHHGRQPGPEGRGERELFGGPGPAADLHSRALRPLHDHGRSLADQAGRHRRHAGFDQHRHPGLPGAPGRHEQRQRDPRRADGGRRRLLRRHGPEPGRPDHWKSATSSRTCSRRRSAASTSA